VSVTDSSQAIILSNWEILMMSAAFCSIEPIVTEKVVDKARYPKLFSIMLGESLYKDTISITLFDAINTMVTNSNDPDYDIEGSDVGYLILGFLKVVIGSMLVGFVMGILTTIIFKNFRFLVKEEGISEVALTILTGFISYFISECFSFSGVISMLFCGTILSHYNVYNISAVGCETTK
jgi:NhaP-type Na+/H+ or K+/H+ antiporter